ncbi:xanthine dehydrogenase family protein molybdopterin-binding subunit [Aurantiacibacter poecillastricola]|uniref:xanthine dehydrogenase family protein molybdopterin-binding subunit n=1 Tax=Aurantiacibacter poecillastricola TaxID=3064385 RepID=UPI00273FDE16|nr:xanthine dehydrogenase family protein molybdopterin-binding subunit [Aurantiacibacter sp. 219JJ12-13]MDP5263161.1 xanthine dehydrogenase family protein molybdopterin-binding subunit [Aurantiacibacter sp. 219JJ12-13]
MSVHLKQDSVDDRNVLDKTGQGVIGEPIERPEGLLKVTGTAPYAAEFKIPDCLEGVLVTAPILRGKVKSIDRDAVLSMPGVVAVLSDERMTGRAAQGMANAAPFQPAQDVEYWGQPVALVVAESFEEARDAAKHLPIEYETEEGPIDPAAVETSPAQDPTRQGDLAQAMNEAAHSVDVTITTEGHASAAMEPHAAIAQWDGSSLSVHASLQMLKFNRTELADSLGLDESKVRLLSPYVGGGFGSKLGISQEAVAASIAAMELGRPVRVVMSRQQVFQTIMRRTETQQRIRLAADADGKLTGFGHEARISNLPNEDFPEPVIQSSQFLYAGENRLLTLDMARIHRMTAGSVRAPGEAVGVQTVEQAMDMLAEKIGIDPIELRLKNLPDQHPVKGMPYSSRKLAECLQQGAEAFGWEKRPRKPRHTREGEWWIGTGVASAARIHAVVEAKARVSLQPDGTGMVESDMTDIGTGTYSILSQIAGEMLGLEPKDVLVRLGDTDFPPGSGSGGSMGASSTGSAVFLACEDLREQLARKLNVEPASMVLKDGFARWDGGQKALTELLDGDEITATGHFEPGDSTEDNLVSSFGAFFAEVAVNHWTGESRVRRMTGAFGFGRVLNRRTARSQCLGGMTWCIGNALTESLLFDPVDGHLANCDLAEYHVPVHRDVPDLQVLMLEERDGAASPIQAKGVGELGLCGGAGAIANAIYDACGARVFEYPMTPDRVLAALERV